MADLVKSRTRLGIRHSANKVIHAKSTCYNSPLPSNPMCDGTLKIQWYTRLNAPPWPLLLFVCPGCPESWTIPFAPVERLVCALHDAFRYQYMSYVLWGVMSVRMTSVRDDIAYRSSAKCNVSSVKYVLMENIQLTVLHTLALTRAPPKCQNGR